MKQVIREKTPQERFMLSKQTVSFSEWLEKCDFKHFKLEDIRTRLVLLHKIMFKKFLRTHEYQKKNFSQENKEAWMMVVMKNEKIRDEIESLSKKDDISNLTKEENKDNRRINYINCFWSMITDINLFISTNLHFPFNLEKRIYNYPHPLAKIELLPIENEHFTFQMWLELLKSEHPLKLEMITPDRKKRDSELFKALLNLCDFKNCLFDRASQEEIRNFSVKYTKYLGQYNWMDLDPKLNHLAPISEQSEKVDLSNYRKLSKSIVDSLNYLSQLVRLLTMIGCYATYSRRMNSFTYNWISSHINNFLAKGHQKIFCPGNFT